MASHRPPGGAPLSIARLGATPQLPRSEAADEQVRTNDDLVDETGQPACHLIWSPLNDEIRFKTINPDQSDLRAVRKTEDRPAATALLRSDR